ncbi:MAG: hypothetical protein CYPHOPRED_005765 [Cyphobasidiales sp. Tagirdzhanova-0007]|nr:MAG: hypothetical protein CYPHOPRED_005765 [Cyphobasidiales sp. Tagirdzhanova-0007]
MLPASQNQCIHLLLIYALEGTPIATLRYFPPPLSKVGRVATGKAFRGMGAGRTMLKGLEALLNGDWLPNEACLMKLEGKSVSEITLHAQVPVIPFYRQLGYVEEGEEFIEDGTPHKFMRKILKVTRPAVNFLCNSVPSMAEHSSNSAVDPRILAH